MPFSYSAGTAWSESNGSYGGRSQTAAVLHSSALPVPSTPLQLFVYLVRRLSDSATTVATVTALTVASLAVSVPIPWWHLAFHHYRIAMESVSANALMAAPPLPQASRLKRCSWSPAAFETQSAAGATWPSGQALSQPARSFLLYSFGS